MTESGSPWADGPFPRLTMPLVCGMLESDGMARLLKQFVGETSTCAYLADRDASLEYRLMIDVSASELDHLLARGLRFVRR